MAREKVDIANLALTYCGISATIASLTDVDQEAIACNAAYDEARDATLGAGAWPFARKIAALQLLGTNPPGYRYRYAYPNDCVKARRIWTGDPTCPADREVPHELLLSEDPVTGIERQTIVTNQADAELEYTKRIDLPAAYPSEFVVAMAWKLASLIIVPLAKDKDKGDWAERRFNLAVFDALRATQSESRPAKPMNRLSRSRRG